MSRTSPPLDNIGSIQPGHPVPCSSGQSHGAARGSADSILHVVARAGAGAGKTTELVRRVLSIAKTFREQNHRWPKIVVCTFTIKATQELRQRLQSQAVQDSDLFSFVSDRTRLQISTIHGVLSQFLRRFGQSVGLPPEFRVMNQREQFSLDRRAVRAAMDQGSPELRQSILDLLVDHKMKSLLSAFHQWQDLGEITRPAPRLGLVELQSNSRSLVAKVMQLSEVIVQEFATEGAGLPATWQQWHQGLLQLSGVSREQQKIIWDELTKPRATPKISPRWLELRDQWFSLMEDWMQECHVPSWQEDWELSSQKLESLFEWWQKWQWELKLSQGAISMNDLELLSLQLLREQPDWVKVFRAEVDHWLVDEFQDTSPRQVELLNSFSDGQPTFTVGDPQQSIYLFRGARSEVFFEREQWVNELSAQGVGEKIVLDTNYRSHPDLVAGFNELFSGFAPMKSGRDESKVDRVSLPVDHSRLQFIQTSEDTEARVAVEHLVSLHQGGIPWSEMAVLARTHKALSRVQREARRLQVPVLGVLKFFEQREVRDALALLRFLLNPHDNSNLIAWLRAPWHRVEDEEIAHWALATKPGASLWLSPLPDSAPGLRKVHGDLQELLLRCRQSGIAQVWSQALWDCELMWSLQYSDPSGQKEASLWQLVQKVRMQERLGTGRWQDLLSEEDSSDPERIDSIPIQKPNQVRLFTIHSSKGLQFPHVVVLGLGASLTQTGNRTGLLDLDRLGTVGRWAMVGKSLQDDSFVHAAPASVWKKELRSQELAEADRVLYVAATRAQDSLLLISEPPAKESWTTRFRLNDPNQQWSVLRKSHLESDPTSGGSPFGAADNAELIDEESQVPVSRVRSSSLQSFDSTFGDGTSSSTPSPVTPAVPVPRNGRISITALLEKSFAFSGGVSTGKLEKKTSLRGELQPAPSVLSATPLTLSKPSPSSPSISDGAWTQLLARVQGVRWHQQLERRGANGNFVGLDPRERERLQWVLAAADGRVGDLAKSGEIEFGFEIYWEPLGVLIGKIDLWGRQDNEVVLVEYKTGSSRYQEKAFQQLEIYAWALEKMSLISHKDRVRLLVLFTEERQQVERLCSSREQIEKSILLPLAVSLK